ncbi:homeobox protein NANOG isoform X2 [Xiphias gladius]|uniref:homeobox protein NANOG isoform X2 n=1 Tax=Xiphias gladius TaxID=8245 RepID=UPI001A998796|nr:homeobox protein NANOG isoform X2 [Xiphias gladius]
MADWKAQISYNYNPSYHAYSYGLVYQPGPELNHGNLTCWGEAGVTDTSNYNTGVTQAFYATTARTHEESPPGTPEQHAVNGHHHHYQGSGVVYLGDTQAGCLLLARPHRTANGVRRAGSDSTSDSEAHTPPDSWSSSCSREGSLHQADPASWEKKNLNKAGSRNPVASKDVSSSLMEEPQTFAVIGNGSTNNITSLHVPINAPNKPSTTAVNNPKGKVRAAFSESQMNALVQRFSVQRYLTPAEMKNLAELTGLTYKQYKGEAQSQLKEHYNQHTMEAAFKKTAPKNLAFYLAAMGSAAGSAGYPSWSSTSSQSIVPNRPQATGWSMPPGFSYYEYNPSAFTSSTANNTGHDISLEIKDDEPANNRSSLYTAIGHNANQ